MGVVVVVPGKTWSYTKTLVNTNISAFASQDSMMLYKCFYSYFFTPDSKDPCVFKNYY